MAPEWDREKKVASTDQLGRLIKLAAGAIELAQEGKRSAKETDALLDTLQTYKDPNKTPKPTIGCCGYPHHDDPKRPNFGPNQVRYLCQLQPGVRVRKHYGSADPGTTRTVLSHPHEYNRGNCMGYKIQVALENGMEQEEYLEDANIIPHLGGWDETDWLSFENPPTHCHHHPCCHH